MSNRTLSHIHPLLTAKSIAAPHASQDDEVERVQLVRLAGAVLSKSVDDLKVLAAENPDLIWEWIDEFRRRKARADAEARMWSAAMVRIAKTLPDDLPVAAE